MARRDVSVEIPINNPDKLIALCDNVVKKHTALAKESPLKQSDVDEFTTLASDGKSLHKEANDLHRQGENKMEQSRIKLGIDKGQTSKTRGTAYFYITKFRDALLTEYKGEEEHLSEYGFNVVVSTSTPGKKKA